MPTYLRKPAYTTPSPSVILIHSLKEIFVCLNTTHPSYFLRCISTERRTVGMWDLTEAGSASQKSYYLDQPCTCKQEIKTIRGCQISFFWFETNLGPPPLVFLSRFWSRHLWEATCAGLLFGQILNSKYPMWLAVSSTRTLMGWPRTYLRTRTPFPYIPPASLSRGWKKITAF